MTNLAQSPKQTQSQPSRSASGKPRVLVVNKPIRSVRPTEESSPLPTQLAIGVIVGLGTIMTLWLLGLIGHQMGFAEAMRTPDLVIEFGEMIVVALHMLMSLPEAVLIAGENRIDLFLLMFALICIPAGGLAAARPRQRGGPPVSALARTFAAIAGVASGIHAAFSIFWIVSPMRGALIRPLPQDPAAVSSWIMDATIVSGLDALLLLSGALWVVLVFRIPAPKWVRSLASPGTFVALVFVMIGFGVSTGLASQLRMERSVCTIESEPEQSRLILGRTATQVAALHVEWTTDSDTTEGTTGLLNVELRNAPETLTVTDRITIETMIEALTTGE